MKKKALKLLLIFIFLMQIGFSMENVPPFLYKILSVENWEESKFQETISLPKEDADFIHFSKEDQLDRIVEKYWADIPEYVILKIDVKKLPGQLVFETNPGGNTKYYHLYNGYIPKRAIVDVQVITNELGVK